MPLGLTMLMVKAGVEQAFMPAESLLNPSGLQPLR